MTPTCLGIGFREHLSVCMCASFPFGFDGGMLDLIVYRVPD